MTDKPDKPPKLCPFMSTPMMVGTRNVSAVNTAQVPVYDLMRVPCVGQACRLWLDGHPEGRCSFEGGLKAGLS